jgi:hypothetical protein
VSSRLVFRSGCEWAGSFGRCDIPFWPEIFLKPAAHRISLVFKHDYCHCQMLLRHAAKGFRLFRRRKNSGFIAASIVHPQCSWHVDLSGESLPRRPRRFLLVVKRDDDRNPSAAVRFGILRHFSMSDGQRGTPNVPQERPDSERNGNRIIADYFRNRVVSKNLQRTIRRQRAPGKIQNIFIDDSKRNVHSAGQCREDIRLVDVIRCCFIERHCSVASFLRTLRTLMESGIARSHTKYLCNLTRP